MCALPTSRNVYISDFLRAALFSKINQNKLGTMCSVTFFAPNTASHAFGVCVLARALVYYARRSAYFHHWVPLSRNTHENSSLCRESVRKMMLKIEPGGGGECKLKAACFDF